MAEKRQSQERFLQTKMYDVTLKLDPAEIVKRKLEISAKKYPVDKSKGRSTKYDKL